jgi:hypothetical protein
MRKMWKRNATLEMLKIAYCTSFKE